MKGEIQFFEIMLFSLLLGGAINAMFPKYFFLIWMGIAFLGMICFIFKELFKRRKK